MRRIALSCCFLFLAIPAAVVAFGQETPKASEAPKAVEPAAHYYRLDFSIQEVGADGKPTNSRAYTATVSTEAHSEATIRVGSRVPIVTGGYQDNTADKRLNMQFQYLDVGVNIYVGSARDVGRLLSLDLKAEVSTLAGTSDLSGTAEPIIRQNYWRSAVLIPIGKPTAVFTSDALENKSAMQVVVTATPLQ